MICLTSRVLFIQEFIPICYSELGSRLKNCTIISKTAKLRMNENSWLTNLKETHYKGPRRGSSFFLASSSLRLLRTTWALVDRFSLWSSTSFIRERNWSRYAAFSFFLTRSSAVSSWIFLSFSSYKKYCTSKQKKSYIWNPMRTTRTSFFQSLQCIRPLYWKRKEKETENQPIQEYKALA